MLATPCGELSLLAALGWAVWPLMLPEVGRSALPWPVASGALLLTLPPVCCSDVLALPIFKQEEPQLSPENEARLPPLQYVLCAATSPAVKLHEETLTYLNQGGAGRRPGGAWG